MSRTEKGMIRVYYCHNAVQGEVPAELLSLEGKDVILEAVPCSGKVDPRYVLKAFEAGARAVCILGCPIGCCKSIEGNLRAVRRVRATRELLEEAGLDPDALEVYLPSEPGESAVDEAVEMVIQFVLNHKAHEVIA